MDYYLNREERKLQAVEWTKEMENKYRDSIWRSAKESIIYRPEHEFILEKNNSKLPRISFINDGTVEALFQIMKEGESGKVALLNFASYKNAGGQFLEGSSAQEEQLCHHSYLFNVLSKHENYYESNRKNLNRGLYTNRAIYSPGIRFFQNDECAISDVITCASPNRSCIRYGGFSESENIKVLKKRMQFIKNIAEENDVDTLILGAWGCGVFKQKAETVANCFEEVFFDTTISNVVYAVPGNDNNAFEFKKKFMK